MATPTLTPPSTTAGGGAPAATPTRKNRTPLVIVVVVMALALTCVGIFAIAGRSNKVAVTATTPQPTQPKAATATTTAQAVPVVTQPSATGATASTVAGPPDTTLPGVTTTTEQFLLSPSELVAGNGLTNAGITRVQDLLRFASLAICGDQSAMAEAFAATADTTGVKAAAAEGCSMLLFRTYHLQAADVAQIYMEAVVIKDAVSKDGTHTKLNGNVRLTLIPDRKTDSWMLGDYPTLITPTA